ncbi:MAG: aspartate kinase [Blastocatellia bacterium]|nr:aspartate kinase [Blastocatellia bacterium]
MSQQQTAHPIRVLKFGGTSVQHAAAIRRLTEIVAAKRKTCRPVVVVSALAGVTDTLLDAARIAARGSLETVHSRLKKLENRHATVLRELFNQHSCLASELFLLDTARILETQLAELELLLSAVATLGTLPDVIQDAVVAFGERLSSVLVTTALQLRGITAETVDARRVIVTDGRHTCAEPDPTAIGKQSRRIIAPLLEAETVVVTQGFIGSTRNGATTTLGRGGSDFTATLLGAALDAEAVEIWTDVNGVLTADPKIIPGAATIPFLTFTEADVLAQFGAKVLHQRTVQPVRAKGIPVFVFNSEQPDGPGTRVDGGQKTASGVVKSIAIIPEAHQTLLGLVGTGIAHSATIKAKVLDTLHLFEAELVREPLSPHCLAVIVDAVDAKRAVVALHEAFFESPAEPAGRAEASHTLKILGVQPLVLSPSFI